ncbi:MAG: hypothetical protein WB384_06010, partial [Candidatus Sulfotelmatobacter sp.]
AALYEQIYAGPPSNEANLVQHEPVGGKQMSFNNYYDGSAALELIKDLSFYMPYAASCVFIKHNNPCGAAVAKDPLEAYRQAYLTDPIATMGGVLAINRPVNRALAEAVMNSLDRWGREAGSQAFLLEVWIAPSFDLDAQAYIEQARPWGRSLRRIATGPMNYPRLAEERDFRKITGGMLVQQPDLAGLDEDDWMTVTQRAPNAQELSDLQLAWLVAKHCRSNAIVIARDGQVLAAGTGQASRLTACRLAVQLAKENGHAHKLAGAVAASDGFFPFKDAPNVLLQAGIKAIIHPGGSKRDAESVAACDEADAVMIMTSKRHFKH